MPYTVAAMTAWAHTADNCTYYSKKYYAKMLAKLIIPEIVLAYLAKAYPDQSMKIMDNFILHERSY